MEDNIEPHEELDQLLSGEEVADLNGDTPANLNETGEPKEEQLATEEPVQEAEPEPEVPPTSEEAEYENKKFSAMLAKTQDEVAKRQALEAQVSNMQKEMENLRAANQPKIDPFENPEAYQQQIEESATQRDLQTRISMSEMIVKAQHEDYEEVVEVFAQAARQNPALAQQMVNSEIPAQFAYQEGQRLQKMQKIGDDPDAYVNALVEQKLAEKLASLNVGDSKPSKPVLPETIANTGSKAPTVNELPDDDLASLLGEV